MATRSTEIYLLPGEHFAGDSRYRISTLLGSCVSITLWHAALRVGAMSHFLLPGSGPEHKQPRHGRYGADALEMMLADLSRLCVPAAECEAKVFGGGAMFASGSDSMNDIGRRNGQAAKAMLEQRHIRIVSESLFEAGHCRIVFSVRSGEVWVRHAPAGRVPSVVRQTARLRSPP